MYVRVIGDAAHELSFFTRPGFRPPTRNCHDGRVCTRQCIRSKQVSCVEVMTAYLDHIEKINPHVNPIVALEDRHSLLAQVRYATNCLRVVNRLDRCTVFLTPPKTWFQSKAFV